MTFLKQDRSRKPNVAKQPVQTAIANVPKENERQIRAVFSETSVRVYQAFKRTIADYAVENKSFPTTFSLNRMTWIKPSFCWMAYRAGYSYKDPNQERIIAVDIRREAFDDLLEQATLAKERSERKTHHVIVQWDPERNVQLEKLGYRSIQIGIRGVVAKEYASGRIIENITDVTEDFQRVHRLVFEEDNLEEALKLLPVEMEYKLPEEVMQTLGMK